MVGVTGIATRLLQAIMVAVLIGTATFAMMRSLPGDAAWRIAAGRYGYDNVNAAAADAVREELGLGGPALPALAQWLADLARLDFGVSLVSGQPVVDEIGHQLGASLALALTAVGLSLVIGPPLGILAGLRPGGPVDRVLLVVSTGLKAVPQFMMALVLILILAVQLRWLPAAGYGGARHFILPSLTLALGLAAVNARIARDAMARIAAMPFYRFAEWKGLSRHQVLLRHGLRNVSVPLVTYLGLQFVTLVEGVVVVDALLALPGLLLVLIVLAIVPGTALGFWAGLSLVLWVEFFRLTRAATRENLASLAVQASRLLRLGPAYIFRVHISPEIAPMMLTAAAFGTATAIMAIAALGFVSVGMRAPTPELGLMMVELLPYWREAPLALLSPVVATFMLLLGLTLLAGSRDT